MTRPDYIKLAARSRSIGGDIDVSSKEYYPFIVKFDRIVAIHPDDYNITVDLGGSTSVVSVEPDSFKKFMGRDYWKILDVENNND